MDRICVMYATREGQTRRIAERVGEIAGRRGFEVRVVDVAQLCARLELGEFRAAVIAASVHAGAHEPEMISFVRGHRRQLDHLPTAFISVSLTEAGAEDPSRTPEDRERASHDVEEMIERFYEQTGWHPTREKPVAGALPYTQYGWIKRAALKAIVKRQGGSTDTSRDHEYTDWPALARFVEDFLGSLARPAVTANAP